MTPRPQPRKPDALDLAETLEIAGLDLIRCAHGSREQIPQAREVAQRVLDAIDEYEGRS